MTAYNGGCVLTCGIYEIVNQVNGKRYVGSSVDIDRRWKEHKRKLRANQHVNPHLQNAYNKYGQENILYSVIELCHEKELLDSEQSHIDVKSEMNMLTIAGRTAGFKQSDETRAKMSAARVRNWEDPAYREAATKRQSENAKRLWQDDVFKAKASKAISDAKRNAYIAGTAVSPLIELWKNAEFRSARTGANNMNHNPDIFSFKHTDGRSFTGTKLDFHKESNVDRSDVNKLVSGKIMQIKGWVNEKAPD